jgi:hypothetical protein
MIFTSLNLVGLSYSTKYRHFYALAPLAGHTTPCSQRRLGTGDLPSTNIGRWNSPPTPSHPAHAVLAGQSHRSLEKAPKGYLGKLGAAATVSDLLGAFKALAQWLTTSDDKYSSLCLALLNIDPVGGV